jgi:hypothetical protein
MKTKWNPGPSLTLSIPQAGRKYFDLSRDASYKAAQRGDIPVIKVGGRYRVPIAAMEQILASATRRGGSANANREGLQPVQPTVAGAA